MAKEFVLTKEIPGNYLKNFKNKEIMNNLDEIIQNLPKLTNKFPNGLSSYLETYYEVVAEITNSINLGSTSKRVEETEATVGRGGLWMLAEDLADKFELQNVS